MGVGCVSPLWLLDSLLTPPPLPYPLHLSPLSHFSPPYLPSSSLSYFTTPLLLFTAEMLALSCMVMIGLDVPE